MAQDHSGKIYPATHGAVLAKETLREYSKSIKFLAVPQQSFAGDDS